MCGHPLCRQCGLAYRVLALPPPQSHLVPVEFPAPLEWLPWPFLYSSGVDFCIFAFFPVDIDSLFFILLPLPSFCFCLQNWLPFLILLFLFSLFVCSSHFGSVFSGDFHCLPFLIAPSQRGVSQGIIFVRSTPHHSVPSKNSAKLVL